MIPVTQPIFPKSTFGWTDRVDQISNVLANDPNSLASEVISMENTLGAMPHVENNPFAGNPVTYSTVGARITDTLHGNQHPYASLSANPFSVFNGQKSGTKFGQYNVFSVVYDPFKMYNGSDITLPCTGLWHISQDQTWVWYNQGWMGSAIQVSQNIVIGDTWRWNFPSSGIGSYSNDRFAQTKSSWLGLLPKGSRVRVVSENETALNPYPVVNSYLRAYCLRTSPNGQIG